jgi:hypothetical protein
MTLEDVVRFALSTPDLIAIVVGQDSFKSLGDEIDGARKKAGLPVTHQDPPDDFMTITLKDGREFQIGMSREEVMMGEPIPDGLEPIVD